MGVQKDTAWILTRPGWTQEVLSHRYNEQANSGLQRIKGQLAYMKPSNFMLTLSLFLTITNQDKIHKIDVSTLHI